MSLLADMVLSPTSIEKASGTTQAAVIMSRGGRASAARIGERRGGLLVIDQKAAPAEIVEEGACVAGRLVFAGTMLLNERGFQCLL